MTGPVAAVVFDCDGTLADTERLTFLTFERVLARYGYRFTDDDYAMIVGRSLAQNWADLVERVPIGDLEGFSDEWYEVSFQLLASDLQLFSDAVESLVGLHALGLPIGIASSSPREHVLQVLDHGDLRSKVDAIVCSEDVPRHKPDPAPYLAAAATLGVDPAACVAVEDTPVGIAAAVSAGMVTVAIRRDPFEPEDLDEADGVVDRLSSDGILRVARTVTDGRMRDAQQGGGAR